MWLFLCDNVFTRRGTMSKTPNIFMMALIFTQIIQNEWNLSHWANFSPDLKFTFDADYISISLVQKQNPPNISKLLGLFTFNKFTDETHYVKSVQMRSYFRSVFISVPIYLSVFSPNAGKYGPEITPYLDIFHAEKNVNDILNYILSLILT